jgi:hypothetical protein
MRMGSTAHHPLNELMDAINGVPTVSTHNARPKSVGERKPISQWCTGAIYYPVWMYGCRLQTRIDKLNK